MLQGLRWEKLKHPKRVPQKAGKALTRYAVELGLSNEMNLSSDKTGSSFATFQQILFTSAGLREMFTPHCSRGAMPMFAIEKAEQMPKRQFTIKALGRFTLSGEQAEQHDAQAGQGLGKQVARHAQ